MGKISKQVKQIGISTPPACEDRYYSTAFQLDFENAQASLALLENDVKEADLTAIFEGEDPSAIISVVLLPKAMQQNSSDKFTKLNGYIKIRLLDGCGAEQWMRQITTFPRYKNVVDNFVMEFFTYQKSEK